LSSSGITGFIFAKNRVICTRQQMQRFKHSRAFVFSAYGQKFKPPVLRVVVDAGGSKTLVKKF
jgi:hypothetical protein